MQILPFAHHAGCVSVTGLFLGGTALSFELRGFVAYGEGISQDHGKTFGHIPRNSNNSIPMR